MVRADTEDSEPQTYGADIVAVYDRLFAAFSRDLAPRVADLLAAELGDLEHLSILDLCCGTGVAARIFAARGARVVGIDSSSHMIEEAERVGMASRPERLTYCEADARAFRSANPIDACTCFYTAINHMNGPSDLEKCTAQVLASLKPGGLFVFDLLGRRVLLETSGDTILDAQDSFQLWRMMPAPRENRSYRTVFGFVREADGRYKRFTQFHVQYAFGLEETREMMLAQGWSSVEFRLWNDVSTPALHPESEGTVVAVARKGRPAL